MASRLPLFDERPDGLLFREDFITLDEATALLEHIGSLTFSNFEMRGAIARRRVAFFGRTYLQSGETADPIPEFLFPLRGRIADWAQVSADAFAMALINEYRPGAPIGWHRDAPQYDLVAGVSLGSTCRMKFRPYVPPRALLERAGPPRTATHELTLTPRSAYLMTGPSRSRYEHSIPPVSALRYSITFRTLRSGVRS